MWALLLAGQLCLSPPDTLLNGNKITVKENGIALLKGKKNKGNPDGIWRYFNSNGQLIMKEKYKHGEMYWRTRYSPKGRVIETTDRYGNVRKRKDCGC